MTRLYCAILTVWYSLTSWNPWTPLGWVMVDGHDYIDEPSFVRGDRIIEPLRCERCGHREELWHR